MDWMVLSLIGGLAAILGFIGCFVPVLPGPAIAYFLLEGVAVVSLRDE